MKISVQLRHYCLAVCLLQAICFVSSNYMPQSLSNYGGGNSGGGNGNVGPVTTAIESTRTVEVKPVQVMGEPHEPQVVEVPSEDMPVTVHFKSQSSRVLVQQTHTPAQVVEPEHTTSEDEPQRVIHEVVKPVIQEIREIIQPYRRLIQQVQPVIEQTHTVIAKGEPRPPVEPLSVDGASTGTISGGGNSGGRQGSSGKYGGSSGGSKYGGSSNYAAAASSVSLKSQSPTSTDDRKSSSSSTSNINRNPQQQQAFSLTPITKQHSNQIQTPSSKYGQPMIARQQSNNRDNSYAARRGEFREPPHMERFDTPKVSLRPASTATVNALRQQATTAKINLRTSASEIVPSAAAPSSSSSASASSASSSSSSSSSLRPISESYQYSPLSAYFPPIDKRVDEPFNPMNDYNQASASQQYYHYQKPIASQQPQQHNFHSDYSMPYDNDASMSSMVTFVAQPVRFRAARA
uniref:Uncharacterized protein n=1 Tax=Dermatophagoides pteronyssinus TaxID=6956 RepID=A0A6P6YG46_DERPT|nr:putative uncharacterized protein DDB_G0277255 [Dermatophagoides pteronyssinus]